MLDIVRQDTEENPSGADRVFTFFRDRLLSGELKAGAEILTDRSVLPRLASCTLSGNAIPTSIMRRLRRRPGVRA